MEHNPVRLYRGPVGVALQPLVERLRGHGLARRHKLVWKAHRAVWLATRSNRVLALGHDIELDPGDALAIAQGCYEPDETAWYQQRVRPGDLVVEVGANIGYFTLLFARLAGPAGRVIAYEPDPLLNAILCRNVARNGYSNVEARQAAVADAAGSAMFYRAKNTGDNRLFSHGPRGDRDSFSVSTVTLDDDLAGSDRRIDLLKMDIQGTEPLALAGMQRLLKSEPPRRMLVEFWPHGITGMGNDPREFVAALRGAGYRVAAMGEPGDLDLDATLRELTPANQKWVNLECTHESEPLGG